MAHTALLYPILQRFLSEKELNKLVDGYESAKITKGRNQAVTDEDHSILKDHLNGMDTRKLASKYKKSVHRIDTSLRMASIYRLKELPNK